MQEFEDFNQWCQYWSNEYKHNINDWHSIIDKGISLDEDELKYICYIEFNNSRDGDAAYNDVIEYEKDYGYGLPSHNMCNLSSTWEVYLSCPNLPLVIRMANNHDGHISWWNKRFLQKPTMNIPFYIPSKPKDDKKGCYIATAVYGSYNCPQVWTLRRFRDYSLRKTWYGQTFIKAYYAISPALVKWFGKTAWFKRLWRKPLDKLVARLNNKGVEDTPYIDK